MAQSTQSTTTQPSMFFKFTEFSSQDALQQINQLTNNFDPQYGISPEFQKNLVNNISSQPTLLQGFLYGPQDPDVTRQVIGKGGCYFHMTTQNCNIHFIWHDRNTNKFLFWGDKYPLIRAMKIIHSRILKYSN